MNSSAYDDLQRALQESVKDTPGNNESDTSSSSTNAATPNSTEGSRNKKKLSTIQEGAKANSQDEETSRSSRRFDNSSPAAENKNNKKSNVTESGWEEEGKSRSRRSHKRKRSNNVAHGEPSRYLNGPPELDSNKHNQSETVNNSIQNTSTTMHGLSSPDIASDSAIEKPMRSQILQSSATRPKRQRKTTKAQFSTSPAKARGGKPRSAYTENKPTKPRIPQARATLSDMRKRVAAILEFIGRTQIELAAEQQNRRDFAETSIFRKEFSTRINNNNDDTLNVENNSINEPNMGKLKNNSSQIFDALFEKYDGTSQMMDGLTRKLLVWEQRYGKYND